ncbi:MAG: DEAD/DEAH box helicase [Arachnia propionica]|nr:MAG: DEAD/DEAH box helicase [Arachnia propionica]
MQWQAPDTAQAETTGQHTGFSELGVDARLVAVLASRGITEPFPIQRATMADVLAGRDVLGRGRTGSGKTLGFGLPMLQRLAHHKRQQVPAGLILSPTRELAMQIADELAGLAQAVELSLTLVAGGMAYGPQLKAFERGVDVVVATPGRLIDLLEQGVVDLSQIKMTVLDEADLMCDMGFYPDVTRIVDATPNGQRLLFSATLDDAVDRLVREYLHKPVTHEADVRAGSAMTHHLLHIAGHHKNEVTAQLATRAGQTLVFTRTQRGAERVAEQLREAGVLAGALHGGLTQGARARVMRAFRETKLPVLVATDVAARGIHVDDVALVLQVDPPMGAKDYVHRAGRTARAGAHGTVISLVLPHQRKLMRRLTGQAKVNAEQLEVTPGCDELVEIIGGPIEHREAVAESVYQELVAPPKPHGRGRRRGAPRRSRR